jgi:hypothetical protein
MVRHAVGVTKDTDGALFRLGAQCRHGPGAWRPAVGKSTTSV